MVHKPSWKILASTLQLESLLEWSARQPAASGTLWSSAAAVLLVLLTLVVIRGGAGKILPQNMPKIAHRICHIYSPQYAKYIPHGIPNISVTIYQTYLNAKRLQFFSDLCIFQFGLNYGDRRYITHSVLGIQERYSTQPELEKDR